MFAAAAQREPASVRLRGEWLGWVVRLGGALPLVLHLARQLRGEVGADPLHAMVHASGFWALTLLLVTLSVTPVRRASVWVARQMAVRFGRRVSDWNFIIRQRRALGLWCFFYAALHVTLHAALEAGSLAELVRELAERPYLRWGLASFVLLALLAITSTRGWMRRLKRHWTRLHRLVYPAAALALLHVWGQTKHGHDLPWGFLGLAVVLLLARVLAWWAGDRQRAAEVPERGAGG